MVHTKIHFAVGLLIGIIITACFFHFFAPRYEVLKSDDTLVKQDKWSGNSWIYKDNKWEKIIDAVRDWTPVDQALTDALNIASNTGTPTGSNKRIKALREKYPVLAGISDQEIESRIKNIYSKKILVDLYFSQIK